MTALRLEGLQGRRQLAAAARSALYHRLARAFAFPDPPLVEELASGAFLAALREEVPFLPFPFPLPHQTPAALADPALAHEEVQQEYIRLFEVGPGQPPCPLYEGVHRPGRMKIMEELVRFYEHFGLRPQPGDQPDHLCAQLEFMHYLAFKETAALTRDGPTAGFVRAQRDFLDRHLCRWLPRLWWKLEEADAAPLYRRLAHLAESFAAADLAALRHRRAKPDTEIVSLPD